MKPRFLLFLLISTCGLAQSRAFQYDETIQLLQSLADAPGPSGFEEPVRKIMVDRMKPLSTRLSYDGLGSVIAVQGSSGPRIMVDAHMDELGGMIRRVTPDGYLTMQMLGGWLDQALVDQRWTIIGSKGPVRAITGIRDIHIVPPDERNKVFPRDSIFLDIGAKSAAEVAAMGLEPGDPVVPDAPFAVMNGTQNYLGKGWDDRVGCAVLVAAMQKLAHLPHANQIFWVATVQEEIGLRGAHTASDMVKPEAGIAIEGGVTRDAPGVRPEEAQELLGTGPALFLYDFSELPNRKFVTMVKQVAKAKNIPLQTDLIQGYGDDSAEIQKSNGGVPTVNMVVPVRYTHSHNGIMNRSDFDHTVDLLVALLQGLDAKAVANLRDFAPQ
ncbi:MAG TPA: M42 family metallopeptidase [Candidatus Limnocylindrales bacterium]|nr:M42 family metallopeptidase [Candidatus Limnocylindrales bacterium]